MKKDFYLQTMTLLLSKDFHDLENVTPEVQSLVSPKRSSKSQTAKRFFNLLSHEGSAIFVVYILLENHPVHTHLYIYTCVYTYHGTETERSLRRIGVAACFDEIDFVRQRFR